MRPFFEGTRPGRLVRAGGSEFEMPVLYFRDDAFGALFSANLDALRDMMPSDHLYPVGVRRGRGLVYIGAFDYLDTSVGPYGELAIVVPAVYGKRPLPILPALFEAKWPGWGGLVLHLPVTTRVARDGGRSVWGYTKFLADMQFENTPELHACRLEEHGEHILTLRVAKRGPVLPDRRPLVTYSVNDGDLVRTEIPQHALVRRAFGARGSSLELGTHTVAASLASLDLDPRPLHTFSYVERAAILPEGEIVEHGVRPLDGYLGTDVEGSVHVTHVSSATIH